MWVRSFSVVCPMRSRASIPLFLAYKNTNKVFQSSSKKSQKLSGNFPGPSRSLPPRPKPKSLDADSRAPAPAAVPRLPRSQRKEIKQKYIEEAAQRGEGSLLSRAARSRTATELKQQEEEKELAQKELSDHKEPIPEKASEDEDETPLTLKADSQQQRVYDVSRKIQQLLLANQITESITQYAELKQLTVPNEEMVRQMIAGLCRNNRVAEAVSLFEEYKGLHPEVTNQLYGAVLLAIGMAGDLKRAVHYFEKAKTFSGSAAKVTDQKPSSARLESARAADVWLYARMLKVYGHHKKLEELVSLLKEVNASGFPQNSLFCATVIEAFGKCGATNLAVSFVADLKKERFPVDIHVYNALLEVLASSKDDNRDEQAASVFLEMPLAGVSPNAAAYASVIRALGSKPTNIARAIELFEQAQTNLCLSAEVYDSMILAYLTAQRVGDATRLYDSMQPRYAASRLVLKTLLLAAHKTQNENLKERVRREIDRRGLQRLESEPRTRLAALNAMKQSEIKRIFAH